MLYSDLYFILYSLHTVTNTTFFQHSSFATSLKFEGHERKFSYSHIRSVNPEPPYPHSPCSPHSAVSYSREPLTRQQAPPSSVVNDTCKDLGLFKSGRTPPSLEPPPFFSVDV
jgi:hypothetical protein